MAPAFRSGGGGTTSSMPAFAGADDAEGLVSFGGDSSTGHEKTGSRRSSMWDRRRRRLEKKSKVDNASYDPKGGSSRRNNGRSGNTNSTTTTNSRQQFDDDFDDIDDDADLDPYDSDPGESYRQHCMKMNGIGTKTCLGVPLFLKSNNNNKKNRSIMGGAGQGPESETVLTAPPSPMTSEMGDLFGQTPASLPANLQRVRYSLRSSITDGSEKQPVGPTVMDRRELRPNNVQINVSHWSDTGGRPYMEDRYVKRIRVGATDAMVGQSLK